MKILEFMQLHGRSQKNTFGSTLLFPRVECADGNSFSIQASELHLCNPCETLEDMDKYYTLEVYTSELNEELIIQYNNGIGTCGRVPVEIVDELLESHGGIVTK